MAEIYHINATKSNIPDNVTPSRGRDRTPSPPINDDYRSSQRTAEMYHVKAVRDDNEDLGRRTSPVSASPPLAYNKKIRHSPVPFNESFGQRPEMYHLRTGEGYQPTLGRHSPSSPDDRHREILNGTSPYPNNDSQRITMYQLTAAEGDNRENSPPPPPPSPPIRPIKKQPAVTHDIVENDHLVHVPAKKAPFVPVLREAPTNFARTTPTSSRASESIQRSMDMFRFGGS